MTESFDDGTNNPDRPSLPPGPPDWLPPPELPPRRWSVVAFCLALLAWFVIVAMVTIFAVAQRNPEDKLGEGAGKDNLNLLTMRAQARYLIGARDMLRQLAPGSEQQIVAQVKQLDKGPVDQRLAYVVMAGELEGPAAAIKALDELDGVIVRNDVQLPSEQEATRTVLRKLYVDFNRLRYDAPSINKAERELLRDQLGWFGKLALAPAGQPKVRDEVVAIAGGPVAAEVNTDCPDPTAREEVLRPATRVTWTIWSAVGVGSFFLLVGFVGFLLVILLLFLGKLRGGLECGWSPAGIYAETFALWMLFFAGFSLALGMLDLGDFRLMASSLGMLASLVVIVWPVIRGVGWRQMLEDIGWTLGRRPVLEPGIGVGCYIMSYPLLVVGIAMVLALMGLQTLLSGGDGSPDSLTSPSSPTHPVVGPLARGDWSVRLQLLFLASVVAPIVEETMFRGVLYRHLRELTRRWAMAVSIIVAGVVSSFIFAAIHPQGLLGIPVLMALAIAFVLIREWRVTLIPCMVAHGLNNGLVLMLSVGMLAD